MNQLAPTFLALMTTLTAAASTQLTAAQAARIDAHFARFDKPDAPGASVMIIHGGEPVFANPDVDHFRRCSTASKVSGWTGSALLTPLR
jgi:CubicO group peptidase (beta-lactamase class C family)